MDYINNKTITPPFTYYSPCNIWSTFNFSFVDNFIDLVKNLPSSNIEKQNYSVDDEQFKLVLSKIFTDKKLYQKYINIFVEQEIDYQAFLLLQDRDLQELKIDNPLLKNKIKKEIKHLRQNQQQQQ